MSDSTPIAISSQFVEVEFEDGAEASAWEASVNKALGLVKDDLQRLAGRPFPQRSLTSGTHRMVMPVSGQARVYAISDKATFGSTGANYYQMQVTRNGVAPLLLDYDTRQTEIIAYRGGMYLGELTVSAGDMIAILLLAAGAPTPLTLSNFGLQIDLKEI